MKLFHFSLLLSLITFSACDNEQRLLEKVDGTWSIEAINYLMEDNTFLEVPFEGGTVTIESCTREANNSIDKCDMLVSVPNETPLFLEYNLINIRNREGFTFQVLGTDQNSLETAKGLLYQAFVDNFFYNVSEDQLTLKNKRGNLSGAINGRRIVSGEVVLRRLP